MRKRITKASSRYPKKVAKNEEVKQQLSEEQDNVVVGNDNPANNVVASSDNRVSDFDGSFMIRSLKAYLARNNLYWVNLNETDRKAFVLLWIDYQMSEAESQLAKCSFKATLTSVLGRRL